MSTQNKPPSTIPKLIRSNAFYCCSNNDENFTEFKIESVDNNNTFSIVDMSSAIENSSTICQSCPNQVDSNDMSRPKFNQDQSNIELTDNESSTDIISNQEQNECQINCKQLTSIQATADTPIYSGDSTDDTSDSLTSVVIDKISFTDTTSPIDSSSDNFLDKSIVTDKPFSNVTSDYNSIRKTDDKESMHQTEYAASNSKKLTNHHKSKNTGSKISVSKETFTPSNRRKRNMSIEDDGDKCVTKNSPNNPSNFCNNNCSNVIH